MALDQEFAIELGQVARRWRSGLDARLKDLGLTQARWIMLLHLNKSGTLSQKDLAEGIGIEGPTAVRLLDALQKQGLIERRESEEDRRVKTVHLTAAAQPLIEEITKISAAFRKELLADLSPDDLATAHRVLKTINDKLERL